MRRMRSGREIRRANELMFVSDASCSRKHWLTLSLVIVVVVTRMYVDGGNRAPFPHASSSPPPTSVLSMWIESTFFANLLEHDFLSRRDNSLLPVVVTKNNAILYSSRDWYKDVGRMI